VLHLAVTARGAMNGLMTEIIEEHIRMHVDDPGRERDSADRIVRRAEPRVRHQRSSSKGLNGNRDPRGVTGRDALPGAERLPGRGWPKKPQDLTPQNA